MYIYRHIHTFPEPVRKSPDPLLVLPFVRLWLLASCRPKRYTKHLTTYKCLFFVGVLLLGHFPPLQKPKMWNGLRLRRALSALKMMNCGTCQGDAALVTRCCEAGQKCLAWWNGGNWWPFLRSFFGKNDKNPKQQWDSRKCFSNKPAGIHLVYFYLWIISKGMNSMKYNLSI